MQKLFSVEAAGSHATKRIFVRADSPEVAEQIVRSSTLRIGEVHSVWAFAVEELAR